MRIIDHRLHDDVENPLDYEESPNFGGALTPEYLIIHYTASASAASAISTLTRPGDVSAHVVIGRDGGIVQLVPFDKIAWHAGRSRWNGRVGLNAWSIGIELENAGRLTQNGGMWRSWFGRDYPHAEVLEATHKNETALSGWHSYTPDQIDAAVMVATTLVRHYKLKDVLGHDDIAPGRKVDPGPAFPMESFRARAMGRRADEPEALLTATRLNIRCGPGTHHDKLEGSPLPKGTRIEVVRRDGSWCFVDVLDDPGGITDLQGWVHGAYVAPS